MTPGCRRVLPILFTLLVAAVPTASGQGPGGGAAGQGPGPGAGQGFPGRSRLPQRDRSEPVEQGTAIIRGRITDDNGRPLRRATVVAFARESRQPRTTLTDADGRFELGALVAGSWQVSASKGGYSRQAYGQRSSRGPGRPVDVALGQTVEKIDISLARGGVIAGRVVDEFGEPMAEANVLALQYSVVNGRRRLSPAGRNGNTDDLGAFRLFGLPPGDYYVSAQVRSPMGFGPDNGDQGPADNSGYAPTYAPGTANVAEAMRVSVAAGQEVTVDVQLVASRMHRVGGTVVSASGQPVEGGFLRLVPKGDASVGGAFTMGLASPIRDGGAFTVLQVPPGAYTLTARVGGGFGPRRRDGGEEAEVAALPIVVSGEDLVGLRVVTNRGLTVPGVLVAEGGTLPTGSPVRIAAQAADPEMMMMGARPVEVGADGRFVIEGLLGEVQVTTMNLARGWMVKSISYRGADVTDKPFEPASDGGTLRIVVTNRITVVTGTVSGDNGGALTDYELIIFPADEARWTNLGRAMRVIRPDQYGVFRAESLPPGDYLVAAFDSLDEEARTNPEFLERVRPLAQDVRLTEGQTRTVTLKLSSPLQ